MVPTLWREPYARWTVAATVVTVASSILLQFARSQLSKSLSVALSIIEFAVFAGCALFLVRYPEVAVSNAAKLSPILSGMTIGLLLVVSLSKHDTENKGPLDSLRTIFVSLRATWNRGLAIESVVAFGSAIAASVVMNVPTARPELMAGVTATSAIVTLSIGWFAVFVQPARGSPNR